MFASRICIAVCTVSVFAAPRAAAGADKVENRKASFERPSAAANAAATLASPGTVSKDAPLNIPTPTMGGYELWGDELFFGQWRIQRHVWTKHCRLLDPDNIRHAWGTYEQCQAKLQRLKSERRLAPAQGKVIIVVHGLAAHRSIMGPLVKHLEKEGGYTVLNITYPSTRATVADHARALAGIIEHLDEVSEINFVAHSMGNIVVRHYLQDAVDASKDGSLDPRIKRFVMLGPPNHGAHAAVALGGNPVFDNVLGESAQQLGRRWYELAPRLATPTCEFGVIAGGTRTSVGWNPLLDGDDDGLVTVSESRLDGAADFALVDVHHFFMTWSPTVHDYTLRFLKDGQFREDGDRQPIVPRYEHRLATPPSPTRR